MCCQDGKILAARRDNELEVAPRVVCGQQNGLKTIEQRRMRQRIHFEYRVVENDGAKRRPVLLTGQRNSKRYGGHVQVRRIENRVRRESATCPI